MKTAGNGAERVYLLLLEAEGCSWCFPSAVGAKLLPFSLPGAEKPCSPRKSGEGEVEKASASGLDLCNLPASPGSTGRYHIGDHPAALSKKNPSLPSTEKLPSLGRVSLRSYVLSIALPSGTNISCFGGWRSDFTPPSLFLAGKEHILLLKPISTQHHLGLGWMWQTPQ